MVWHARYAAKKDFYSLSLCTPKFVHSQLINRFKTFNNKTKKAVQDTKPFCRLSIPTARLRINIIWLLALRDASKCAAAAA